MMPYVLLGVVLVLVALGMVAVLVAMMAHQLLRPPRMTDGKAMYVLKRLSPEDLGLPFETVRFTVRDEATGKPLRLAAWWIGTPAPSSRTVVILHGYSDAKVGGIAWAPLWRSLGWNVLALDLRAHGESEGVHSTGGYFDREDVSQVIDQLRAARPASTRAIALFGVSLGAAVACGVGARRDDLSAVILESPYSDYRVAVASHGRRLGMPIEWAYGLAYRLAEKISGARFDQMRPIDLIPQIRAPLLIIHAGGDTFVQAHEIDALQAALRRRDATAHSESHLIPDVQHTMGLLHDPDAYREAIARFLDRASAASPAQQRQGA